MMIFDDRLALKRGPHLLPMGILLISESRSAEFVVECIFRWETGLDEEFPGVHGLVYLHLLEEKDIELIVLRAVELVHHGRPKIHSDCSRDPPRN